MAAAVEVEEPSEPFFAAFYMFTDILYVESDCLDLFGHSQYDNIIVYLNAKITVHHWVGVLANYNLAYFEVGVEMLWDTLLVGIVSTVCLLAYMLAELPFESGAVAG
jgi:hypothetical protein